MKYQGLYECDLIDNENIIDDKLIPKPPIELNLNDSESISYVLSPRSYYNCHKRKKNDLDDFKKLIKLEEEKTLITMEMLKNKPTTYGICLMLKEKLDDCTNKGKKDLTTIIFDATKDFKCIKDLN
ncbi:unnamed protein product [Gordionus sp. m RMFG-2023]|uniref:uncharacterized protein LOC135926920 n=1 Tax=Gordionus sp. m RMFG-2023 TaxID=3053472 RepID=UPI0030DEB4C1